MISLSSVFRSQIFDSITENDSTGNNTSKPKNICHLSLAIMY